MAQTKRILWLDYARVAAILFVVVCHATEGSYYFIRMGEKDVTFFTWLVENILFTIGRFGVPLFVMISGGLMLEKEYSIGNFYKNRLLPLLVTTEIWIVICYFFSLFVKGNEYGTKEFLYNITFLKQSPLSHMWYMPMILGLYLVVPFVSKALKNISFKEISLPILCATVAFLLVPLFNAVSGEVIEFFPDAKLTMDVGFLGGIYGLLLVMGNYISNNEIFKKIRASVIVIVFLFSFICNSIGARYFYVHKLTHSDVFGWYTSPFIVICSICLFELFRRIPQHNCPKIVEFLSKGSFVIYLVHNLVLYVFNEIVKNSSINGSNDLLMCALRFFVSMSISILVVLTVNKIPLTRFKKYVFYLKQ